MTAANQLLRDYARNGSEAAFRELVRRYVNLVHSVAMRRVGWDSHCAEDVTQTVFTDLATKAASLPDGVMLGGWLHRHTCFVSSNWVRSERRRQAREREAVEMNLLQNSSDPAWKQLAPLLDGAIDELEAADREAVVLRFFEQRDLRSVGVALGISEDAAQKRVSRALERLRDIVGKEGVTLSATVFAGFLTAHAVLAAPAGLAATVSGTALTMAASGVAVAGGLLKILAAAKFKLALAAIVAVVAGLGVVLVTRQMKQSPKEPELVQTASVEGVTGSESSPKFSVTPRAAADVNVPASTNKFPEESGLLKLTILAAGTDKPVPGVQIDYRRWDAEKFTGRTLHAASDGMCDVSYAAGVTTELELTARLDGFADTKLHWRVNHGEQIPTNYLLRLTQPVPIGGKVVDADGNPVAGAKVGWNHEAAPQDETGPESHEFAWIEVKTDAEGRWRINRIAPEMIQRLYGSARHTDYVDTGLMFTARDREAEKQLLEEKHVFQLGRAVRIRGIVSDTDGQPVAGAQVLFGQHGMSGRRETKSLADGSFSLAGCALGKNLLSAEAKGFSATTVEVEVTADSESFQLKLKRGKLLLLRVVSQDGSPVDGANVWLNTFDHRMNERKPAAAAPVQAEFNPKTDQDGRVIWFNAPDGKLSFDVAAGGHMRVNGYTVEADGEEHVITMPPGLVILGTVRDAASGELIPNFRIVAGWPSSNPFRDTTNINWSTIDRHWLTFSGGKFQHSFEEPLIYGTTGNPGYALKFAAEGYAPLVSRVIGATEGEVKMDVELKPAAATTVTVLGPDGYPAANADVGLVSPGAGLQLQSGGFARDRVQGGGSIRMTDAKGKFQLPPDETIQRVIVASLEGYGEASVGELAKNPTLQTRPWGRIEGTYLSSGQPVVGRELLLGFEEEEQRDASFDFNAFKIVTDSEGKFSFPRVPWGKLQLIRLVVTETDGNRKGWAHAPLQKVEVRPGDTTTVIIGNSGYSVVARLRWPDGVKPGAGMQFHGAVHTQFPKPPEAAMKDPEAMKQWAQSPEIRELQKSMRSYICSVDPEGVVTAEDVPPGQYELGVGYFSILTGTNSAPIGFEGGREVHIPADPPTGHLDLGEILLRKLE